MLNRHAPRLRRPTHELSSRSRLTICTAASEAAPRRVRACGGGGERQRTCTLHGRVLSLQAATPCWRCCGMLASASRKWTVQAPSPSRRRGTAPCGRPWSYAARAAVAVTAATAQRSSRRQTQYRGGRQHTAWLGRRWRRLTGRAVGQTSATYREGRGRSEQLLCKVLLTICQKSSTHTPRGGASPSGPARPGIRPHGGRSGATWS